MEASSVWIIGIVALAIGAIIGYLLGRSGGGADQQMKLVEQLEETQQELNHYKEQVNSHFAQTAELVNNLTESYKDVHQHLARGAQSLCADDSAAQSLTASLQPRLTGADAAEGEIPTVTDAVAEQSPEPPRDYAPKAPDQEGTLSESFGLKEKQDNEEPQPGPVDAVYSATAKKNDDSKTKSDA
ncbi:YhcB family protein [Marinobacterium arenosum]|uniref:YhcB family protein n=1 Tax=Marinobacterium arenosum TaxID=2862496 RepID=UPI001C969B18|nr:DUF1043 family protein [Marinobacterium arenosum]MBY4678595.1 YhcB family protein [Marinobacterium arenosum]